MYILSVETTTKTMSVAISLDNKLIALTTVNSKNTHSATLLPTIKNLLDCSSLLVSDIDVFACSSPGSFTGVRIGAATIKGLAYPHNKPCVSVSSLMALSKNVSNYNGIICPVMDARRNQVYNALFSCIDGQICRLTQDRAIAVDELEAQLNELGGSVMILGDGSFLLSKNKNYIFANEHTIYQNAFSVCLCAYEIYNEEKECDFSPSKLKINYLRPSSAKPLTPNI